MPGAGGRGNCALCTVSFWGVEMSGTRCGSGTTLNCVLNTTELFTVKWLILRCECHLRKQKQKQKTYIRKIQTKEEGVHDLLSGGVEFRKLKY